MCMDWYCIVKLKFCAQPMHEIFVIKYCLLLELIYQSKNELPSTSMAFTMIVSRFEKSHCLLKSSVPLPWQLNLIKTLATGAISKLTIQTRKPIPTYTLLNPVRLLWTWHFKHSVYFLDWLLCNGFYKLWKMVGLKYNITTCQ